MPGQNDLGPYGPGVNETYTEPDAAALGDSGGGAYSWFRSCTSAAAADGTRWTAMFGNRILKTLRRACDGMGIPRNEADGDRLLKAIQKADRPISNIGDGVAVYMGDDVDTRAHKLRTIKGMGGIQVRLTGDGDGDTDEVVIDGTDIVGGTPGDPGSPVVLKAVRVLTSSGTWTKPAGLSFIVVEGWGAGGAGGAGYSNVPQGQGGGGQAGGYFRRRYAAGDLGATEAYTIGAGGVGTTDQTARGGTGGSTTFKGMTAAGGEGGGAYNTSPSVTLPGGKALGGVTGGDAQTIAIAGPPGSQGGHVGLCGAGAAAISGAPAFQPSIGTGSTTPAPGIFPGGGGAGGFQAAMAGGNGAAGLLIISEYGV